MKISKIQSKQLQGIAILCMLGLHLFNRTNISSYYDVSLYIDSVPLLTIISYCFDCCVPIYLFCSGYGLYKSYNANRQLMMKSNKKRILNLLVRFWLILCITCLIGFCLGMKDTYPGTLLNFIENVLLIKSSYVGAFWFVQTYVLLVLTSKYIFKLMEKRDTKIIVFVSIILYAIAFLIERKILILAMPSSLGYLLNAFMLYLRSQFSFVVGVLFASRVIIDKESKIVILLSNKWIVLLILLLVIGIRGFILPSMVFAPFSAFVFIILFGLSSISKIIEKVLLFFGNHSTNMWLTHMQFYMIFTPSLVFMSRNVFVIFITLIGLSLVSSIIINLLLKFLFGFRR